MGSLKRTLRRWAVAEDGGTEGVLWSCWGRTFWKRKQKHMAPCCVCLRNGKEASVVGATETRGWSKQWHVTIRISWVNKKSFYEAKSAGMRLTALRILMCYRKATNYQMDKTEHNYFPLEEIMPDCRPHLCSGPYQQDEEEFPIRFHWSITLTLTVCPAIFLF